MEGHSENKIFDKIYIDFLGCHPGKEYYKIFQWHSIDKISKIESMNSHNAAERAFTVREDKAKYNTLNVTFKPLLADYSYYEYFHVMNTTLENKMLCLFGKTLAVNVQCQTKLVCFNCSNLNPVTKSVSLVNKSMVDTCFQFFDDSEHSGIKMKPVKGDIKGNETVKVVISYIPRNPGFTFSKLFCLIRYQGPLIINVHTNVMKTSSSKTFHDYIYTNETIPKYFNAFVEYTQDLDAHGVKSRNKPIFAINRRFIDFGFRDMNENQPPPIETFTVYNNALVDSLVSWNAECFKTFRIEPKSCVIKRSSYMMFTATFQPPTSNLMYNTIIPATLNWGTNYDFVIPFPLSVNLMGHSLRNCRSGWDQFYSLDSNRIVLPATVPSNPTASTLLLTNTGKFPMMYKLIPPNKPNFVVKPVQGIINDGFQIVVVALNYDSGANIICTEDWELELNAHKRVKIKFVASAELPFLHISDGSIIKFPTTNLYCETFVLVPIENKTRLHIKFKIISSEAQSSFYDENPENFIGPLQQIDIKMYFKPQVLGKIVSSLYCDLSLTWPEAPSINSKTVVLLEGNCGETSLLAQPNHLFFDVLLDNFVSGTFILYNNSEGNAYVRLYCSRVDVEQGAFSYSLKPEFMALNPNSNKQIEIKLLMQSVESYQLRIRYVLYTTETFTQELPMIEHQVDLVEIDVYCEKPFLRIIDIYLQDTGPNLTKQLCWKMLKIDELNKILLNVLTSSKMETVYMKLPTFARSGQEIIIKLLLKNKSKYGAYVNVIPEKSCSCECKLINQGISRPTISTKCLHDFQIYCVMKNSKYMPAEEGVIEIHCKYTATDIDLFKFSLIVSSTENDNLKGAIDIVMERNCFDPELGYIDFYTNSLNNNVFVKLDPVFIGDPCKPIQVIWVYNNSFKKVNYEMSVNNNYKEIIFFILNGKGCISSNSMHPIMIKFTPYQLMNYNIECEFHTSVRKINLHILAEGSCQPCYDTYSMADSLSNFSLFENQRNVRLSVDHITLKPMLLHSLTKKIIFLRNNTNERIKFYFVTRQFGALLKIKAVPDTGVIDPDETAMCQIYILALSTPSRFTAHITCKTIYLDKKIKYLQNLEEIKNAARIFDSKFTYIDEEYKPPESNIKKIEKPRPEFINLSISVHTLSERFLDMVMPDLENQMKSLNQSKIFFLQNNHKLLLSKNESEIVIDVLSRIIWEVLHKKIFLRSILYPPTDYYYKDILAYQKKKLKKIPPNIALLNILNGYICTTISSMFKITNKLGKSETSKDKSKAKKNEEAPFQEFHNTYYSEILHNGCNDMLSLYNEDDTVIERRRSGSAFKTLNFDWVKYEQLKKPTKN